MSNSDLQALLSKSYEDPELEARLAASHADPVAVAAAFGLQITAEEVANSKQSWEDWRISSLHDEET